MLKPNDFTEIEKEILILKSVIDIINSIVNNMIIKLHYTQAGLVEVRFRDYTEKYFFNIFLVDLLSQPSRNLFSGKSNYIELLSDILKAPSFNIENSVENLKESINEFKIWLDTIITIEKMWFPSINIQCNFRIKRIDIMLICGNTRKHNTTRLTMIALTLKKIFKENNIDIDDIDSILVIEDFDNWFHGDGNIFSYYASILTEMLNDIRWGMQDYLLPEYRKSHTPDLTEDRKYSFKYPIDVEHRLAQTYYWNLMNDIRGGCIFEKFNIPNYMKNHY